MNPNGKEHARPSGTSAVSIPFAGVAEAKLHEMNKEKPKQIGASQHLRVERPAPPSSSPPPGPATADRRLDNAPREGRVPGRGGADVGDLVQLCGGDGGTRTHDPLLQARPRGLPPATVVNGAVGGRSGEPRGADGTGSADGVRLSKASDPGQPLASLASYRRRLCSSWLTVRSAAGQRGNRVSSASGPDSLNRSLRM